MYAIKKASVEIKKKHNIIIITTFPRDRRGRRDTIKTSDKHTYAILKASVKVHVQTYRTQLASFSCIMYDTQGSPLVDIEYSIEAIYKRTDGKEVYDRFRAKKCLGKAWIFTKFIDYYCVMIKILKKIFLNKKMILINDIT